LTAITCYGIAIGIAGMAWISGPQNTWGRKMPPVVGLAVGLAGLVIAILGLFFTRGKGVSITRNLRTGKTIRRRGYYEN